MSDTLVVAKLGKSVGLRGELKLHLLSDFPEQFKKGSIFTDDKSTTHTIQYYNHKRNIIKFEDTNTKEEASKLTNRYLYSTLERSFEECRLKEGEYFWFELEGAKVVEDDITLGVVSKIERVTQVDYLIVKTDDKLTKNGYAKEFLIPYIDRYIIEFDEESMTIYTKDTLKLLEAS